MAPPFSLIVHCCTLLSCVVMLIPKNLALTGPFLGVTFPRMPSEEYRRQLRDPRWQKMRLRVFERDGWRCVRCGEGRETLHIHHTRYSPGPPWEIDLGALQTLCEACHDRRHGVVEEFAWEKPDCAIARDLGSRDAVVKSFIIPDHLKALWLEGDDPPF